MKNYQQFYSTLLLESILHVEPNFAEIIKSLANVDNVAKELSNLFEQDIDINNNYLQLGDAEDLVYFIPDSQAQKAADPWGKKNSAKIGRLVNQLLTSQKINVSSSEIEKFVNRYKTAWKEFKLQGSGKEPITLVHGEDIKKWYLKDNYDRERGQLGNSCMRYRSCQDFFDIYVKNPEVCQLLILKPDDDKDKIKGRALVWKLTDGEYYMDRIYTINDSDKILFQDYARINKIKNSFDNNSGNSQLIVKLGDYTYQKYPYMDTFVVYNHTTKILRDDEDLWPGQGYISLQDTQGGFRSDDAVYSNWQDEYINRESAVYCDNVDDWLSRDSANYL
jgi:hypothetical protein